ncbi:hypothetical protein EN833_13130 [Mesorhizobium sp. M4B.F.Ca.ET.190.01.1.1]|uniref:AAA family ATPase n=2 Tax=Mesorhizobium TaxID=68287 RepID=UPI001092F2AF|nr:MULTISPECIES: AAA family ATPase [unclassified Mesorhizobium]TGR10473.1 hypothetical protein EN843_13125 [Mesorhizobium sp. M4B.F.Ca.ET.200.01.1.1]TGS19563.1 hypothetical protein EN833_13130 [Mesorhizobium sp. M4B.F.Ca.ET.190.01.1.1]TGT32471.1 hypothetical protein EN815_08305 [Mesorhizobium sp. M4B.F.Ca.ET.172.01.1.1]
MALEFVLAFSGGLGAGKSSLTKALSERLGWPRASFGDHVRTLALENGLDSKDRAVLQQLGQALVLTNVEGFVDGVLGRAGEAPNLILDGVRHVEVLFILREKLQEKVKLVHLEAPSDVRQERYLQREAVERRLLARYEQDITEAQIARILPQYADLTVDATLPLSFQVEKVVEFARKAVLAVKQAA